MSDANPIDDHMRAAYAALRKAEWPPLPALVEAAQRFALVRGAAQRIARGDSMHAPITTPPTPAVAATRAARALPSMQIGALQRIDRKSAAAGERLDDEAAA